MRPENNRVEGPAVLYEYIWTARLALYKRMYVQDGATFIQSQSCDCMKKEMKIKQAKERKQIIRNSSGVRSSPQTKEFTLSQHAVEWADYYSSLRTLVEKRLSSRKKIFGNWSSEGLCWRFCQSFPTHCYCWVSFLDSKVDNRWCSNSNGALLARGNHAVQGTCKAESACLW